MGERVDQLDLASKVDAAADWGEPRFSPEERQLLSTDLKPSSDFALPVVDFVKEHPVATAATVAAGLAVGYRLLARSAERVGKELIESAATSSELRAGQGLLRDFSGAAIPDIERPFLKELVDGAAITAKAREGYAADLMRAAVLPKTAVGLADETLDGFASRLLNGRVAITGERVSAETIAKESQRIASLNTGIFAEAPVAAELNLAGKTLTTMNPQHFAKLAEEIQFKHVPQLGQLMKATGRITEGQIDEAIRLQQTYAKGAAPRLGEILVDKGLAAKADVDLAFASQNELKLVLKNVRDKFLSIEEAHAAKVK